MDHILEGVLASGHPDPMKRQLIEKISEKGQDQHPANDIRGVLNLSMNWMLQGTSELQVRHWLEEFHFIGSVLLGIELSTVLASVHLLPMSA